MTHTFSVEIRGILPEPWEAPTGAIGRKGGGLFVRMVKSTKLATFQAALHDALEQKFGERMLESIVQRGTHLELRIWIWRPIESTVRESGRKASAHVADATNLQKAIEDACQGVLFANDRDNLVVQTVIMEQDADATARIIIEVTRAPHLPEPPEPTYVIDAVSTWEGNDVAVRQDDADDLF